MPPKANRPIGITAISTLMVTLGAQIAGLSIFAMCSDIHYLSTQAGSPMEYTLLAFIFLGFSTAGFGIGLYEGWHWARSASLCVLSFFATLKAFSVASVGLFTGLVSVDSGLLLLLGFSVMYLSLPQAKSFFAVHVFPVQQAAVMQHEPAGVLQHVS